MIQRQDIPDHVSTVVLAANNHTCCICHKRKHVQLHHIDGDPSNNREMNLAVLCLDCHSRVTGDEGLGRRYSEAEVRLYKSRWEETCRTVTPDVDNREPTYSKFESTLLGAEEDITYDLQLEEGQEVLATVAADEYIDVSICNEDEYERSQESGDLNEYEGAESVREWEGSFVAPRAGKYLLVLMNESREEVDVTVDISVW